MKKHQTIIGKGLLRKKSEDQNDLEINQNFILDDLQQIYMHEMHEIIQKKLSKSKGYSFEIKINIQAIDDEVYEISLKDSDEWLDVIKRPDPRNIGVLCIDGTKEEPQFIGNLPFDFSEEDLNQMVNISKENDTPLKINVFHDINRMDHEEFSAQLYMHEHNKHNRSLTDEERADFMRKSMGQASEEEWVCDTCESEQEAGAPYYMTQYGLACLSCFEMMMGIDEQEEDDEEEEFHGEDTKKNDLN